MCGGNIERGCADIGRQPYGAVGELEALADQVETSANNRRRPGNDGLAQRTADLCVHGQLSIDAAPAHVDPAGRCELDIKPGSRLVFFLTGRCDRLGEIDVQGWRAAGWQVLDIDLAFVDGEIADDLQEVWLLAQLHRAADGSASLAPFSHDKLACFDADIALRGPIDSHRAAAGQRTA